jgi:hypothetical protein
VTRVAAGGRHSDNVRPVSTKSILLMPWVLSTALAGSADGLSSEPPNLGPLIVHVVNPFSKDMVLPDDAAVAGLKSTTIRVTACRGEYEAASFVLSAPGTKVENITLVSRDLTNDATGARIDAKNTDIRVVKAWYQGYLAWNEISKSAPQDFRERLVPELLLKDDDLVRVDYRDEKNLIRITRGSRTQYVWVNPKQLAHAEQAPPTAAEFPVWDAKTLQPISIQPYSNKQLWVTVFVPGSTPSGRYSGQIQVNADGKRLGVLRVEVVVPDFDLAASKVAYSIYYRAVLDPQRASISSEYRDESQMRAELEDMVRHGIDDPTLYQPITNKALFRLALELRQESGANRGELYFLGLPTTEPLSALRDNIPRVREMAHEYGYTGLSVYGKDEAQGKELKAEREVWATVHAMGAKVFVAGSSGAYEIVGDLLDTFVHANQPKVDEAVKWHNRGHEIFNYGNPQSAAEDPFLFRLNYGLVLWANDYDGAMPYAYQHCFGSCWNDIDDPIYRDHNLTYPTADGVIGTLAWEGLREAVNDVRFLSTLEALIREANVRNNVVASDDERFLQALKTNVRQWQTESGKYNQNMNIDLDSLRADIILRIMALKEHVLHPG